MREINISAGKFYLHNDDKIDRALYGSVIQNGTRVGGVGDAATEQQLIAEYDRLGGHITTPVEEAGTDDAPTVSEYKVKRGCFYDFAKKRAVDSPKVVMLFRVNGNSIEVPLGAPLPIAVKAQQIADEQKEAAKPKRSKKAKKEDDEE